MSHSEIKLGTLEPVDLREVWKHEAHDFTNWLAGKEGLSLLSNALGMELELEGTEQSVGSFRADLVCRDKNTNMLVLVENQLEQTNHPHLGQLLTYASGLDAVTLVWVAKNFHEKHRGALDWLNNITDEKINFFGLEMELWKIGNAPPLAPKFNIVSKPNGWSRSIKHAGASQFYWSYWDEFNRVLIDSKGPVSDLTRARPRSPSREYYMSYSIGKSDVNVSAVIFTSENRLQVVLHLGGALSKKRFEILSEHKKEIEKQFGEKLVWQTNKGSNQIICPHPDVDLRNKNDWPKQHEWLAEKLNHMHKVFAKRVKDF